MMSLGIYDYSNSHIISLIDEHINGRHAERNRSILKRRLIDGIPFEPLAEEFDISTRQCKRIVYVCMDKLSKYI
jgi:hypothetical protein